MTDTPVDTPPDRLSLDPRSAHYDEPLLSRGVGIKFNGQEKTNVIEYSISDRPVSFSSPASLRIRSGSGASCEVRRLPTFT